MFIQEKEDLQIDLDVCKSGSATLLIQMESI